MAFEVDIHTLELKSIDMYLESVGYKIDTHAALAGKALYSICSLLEGTERYM